MGTISPAHRHRQASRDVLLTSVNDGKLLIGGLEQRLIPAEDVEAGFVIL